MPNYEEADRRIHEKEMELARLQANESTFTQIEAHLTRDALKESLTTAATIAGTVGVVLDEFEASVQRMADDLNGPSRN